MAWAWHLPTAEQGSAARLEIRKSTAHPGPDEPPGRPARWTTQEQ